MTKIRFLMFLGLIMQVVPMVEYSEASQTVQQNNADQLLALGIPEQAAVQHLIGHLVSGADINEHGFAEAYRRGIRNAFNNINSMPVHDNDGRVVGVIWDSGIQVDIFVHPDAQRRGLGRRTLSQYINARPGQDISVSISTNNISSLMMMRRVLEQNNEWHVTDITGNVVNVNDIDGIIRGVRNGNPVVNTALAIESLSLTIRS